MASDGNSGTKADKVQRWPAYAVAAVALLFALADFLTEPGKMELTAEVLFAILIAFAAVFAGQFDKVSFVKLLSLERDFRTEKQDKKEAVERADQLASLLVSASSSSKSNASTFVTMNVERDSLAEEVAEEVEEQLITEAQQAAELERHGRISSFNISKWQEFAREAEQQAIRHLTAIRGEPTRTVEGVSLEEEGENQISTLKQRFDALLVWPDRDEFVEVKTLIQTFAGGFSTSKDDTGPPRVNLLSLFRSLNEQLLIVEKYAARRMSRSIFMTILVVVPKCEHTLALKKKVEDFLNRKFHPALERGLLKIEFFELEVPGATEVVAQDLAGKAAGAKQNKS